MKDYKLTPELKDKLVEHTVLNMSLEELKIWVRDSLADDIAYMDTEELLDRLKDAKLINEKGETL